MKTTSLLAIAILLLTGWGDAPTYARTSGPTDREVASFVRLVNQHRIARGLPALIWDDRVAAVAREKSRDMRDKEYFSHTWSDGRPTWPRLTAHGVRYAAAGENIAWGQPTGSAVLRSWLHSRGHRKNIEDRAFTHHGVAKVGVYWTHIFIRPRREAPARREDSGRDRTGSRL